MNKTIIGLQFGDEGKGKISDIFAKDSDFVVRFNGGANAGHTVIVDKKKYVFHLIPSSILHPNTTSIIGSGAVLDLETLYNELISLQQQNIKLNLKISPLAHVITPEHKTLDAQREAGSNPIGTTKRGIGPCYADKAKRTGVRIKDLYQNTKLTIPNLENILKFLKPFVADTQLILQQAIETKKSVLFEGAQGLMLDLDYGTYPYVTSSSTHPSNAAISNGISPSSIGEVWGVTKAYATRVGLGPFPTELLDATGDVLRKAGNEFGSTTGRPRRCGWLDLVQLDYAIKMSGTQKIVMTKLDILAEMDSIKICTKYKNSRGEYGIDWDNTEPEYITWPKFPKLDWSKIIHWHQLPDEILSYIKFVEQQLNTPIEYVSLGPERDSLIHV